MMKHRSGFTAVELLVTLSIIGILAAISIPSYAQTQKNLLVKQTAAQVGDIFRQAQTKAIASFDSSPIRVTLSGNTLTTTMVSNGSTRQWSTPSGITISATTGTITFAHLTGRASSASTYTLTNNSQTATVVISSSGKISVQ